VVFEAFVLIEVLEGKLLSVEVERYGEEDRYDRREREGKAKGGKLSGYVGAGQGISLVAHRRFKTQRVTLPHLREVQGGEVDGAYCLLLARMGNSISETNACAA
jgi:hypothetical protein